MIPQQLNMDLLDYVNELTQPYKHREHYTTRVGATTFGLDHVTAVPPLLHQLQFGTATVTGEDRGGGGGYESQPVASLHSIDVFITIDKNAARWVRELGEDDPDDTLACVKRLPALARSLPPPCRVSKRKRGCCTFHDLERDVRHWWIMARVVTGWDSPAWRPDNTCPMCGARNTLRVKLVDQVALCAECHEAWDQATIGLLAEHIRAESAGERPTPLAVHCWCPFPRPAADAWPSLCPTCASPWCHRAGWAATLEGPSDTPEHAWVS